MKIDTTTICFNVKFKYSSSADDSIEQFRSILRKIGWEDEAKGAHMIYSHEVNHDLSMSVCINDKHSKPRPNEDWAEEFFKGAVKCKNVDSIELYHNKASDRLFYLHNKFFPLSYKTGEEINWEVIYKDEIHF